MRRLAENAGVDGQVVIENVRRYQVERKSANLGYNVMTGEYTDMLAAGILDPAKVTRSAVENAASIAAMVLTTEAMITDKPEPKPAAAVHAARRRDGLLVRHPVSKTRARSTDRALFRFLDLGRRSLWKAPRQHGCARGVHSRPAGRYAIRWLCVAFIRDRRVGIER